MTSDEVKGILDTIETTLETVKAEYSKEFSAGIVDVISRLTPANVKLLAALLGADADKISQELASVVKIVKGLDNVFLTDKADKIIEFCQKLENRPLILKFIAWKLG